MTQREKGRREATFVYDQLLTTLHLLSDAVAISRESLPASIFDSIASHLAECQGFVTDLKESSVGPDRRNGGSMCDVLYEIAQVISAHDAAFLQRNIHHQLHAAPDVPNVSAAPEQIRLVVAELLAYTMQIATKGSTAHIVVREVPLRQGSGLECSIVVACPSFSERDRYRLFEEFAMAPRIARENANGASPQMFAFALCRQVIESCQGQLWVEIPTHGKAAFTFVVPCVQDGKIASPPSRVKCDIVVTNYPMLKETFGGTKVAVILHRIAALTRDRIRHPIDAVAAFESRGVVSAIMELPVKAIEPVIQRLSEVLRREEFHIGRHTVAVTLDYRVAPLP